MFLAAAMSSSTSSPPDTSDDGSAATGTASSNITLLYIIIAVLVGVILYMAILYGRSVLAEWRQRQAAGHGTTHDAQLGLSMEDIAALPTFTYRARAASASPHGGGGNGRRSGSKGMAATVECVVCLQEMEDGDVVRVLPSCRHFFHGRCIDAWLCAHSSCPVCRAHPEPERARLGEVAVSPPLPQLRRCGVSPERPTSSRVLADILARSPLRSSCSTSGSKEMILSKSPSPRVQFGSRSPSPTPMTYDRVDDWWTKSPPPGVSEIVVVPSNSPSPIRFSRQLSARSIGVLESMEVITSASPSPVLIREGGGSLSKSPSPAPHVEQVRKCAGTRR
ncbi:E3 ubiquitin-protein ligase EL5-like [Phragmites australis]|uniref:E3 ubiquitin-protein ligase EL5-like n=1 Tax=Phragmites australis TaxID=29695 RepID=UPI002D7664C5|nr:E3 ubiquitin-protein ligase EL5-like [Phragmites australis]